MASLMSKQTSAQKNEKTDGKVAPWIILGTLIVVTLAAWAKGQTM